MIVSAKVVLIDEKAPFCWLCEPGWNTLTFPKCCVEQSVLSGAVGVAWVWNR